LIEVDCDLSIELGAVEREETFTEGRKNERTEFQDDRRQDLVRKCFESDRKSKRGSRGAARLARAEGGEDLTKWGDEVGNPADEFWSGRRGIRASRRIFCGSSIHL